MAPTPRASAWHAILWRECPSALAGADYDAFAAAVSVVHSGTSHVGRRSMRDGTSREVVGDVNHAAASEDLHLPPRRVALDQDVLRA